MQADFCASRDTYLRVYFSDILNKLSYLTSIQQGRSQNKQGRIHWGLWGSLEPENPSKRPWYTVDYRAALPAEYFADASV